MAWRICIVLFFALSIFTFTPAVIPAGVAEPFVLGLPRTLWMGLLVSFAYAGLALAAALLHPGRQQEGKSRPRTKSVRDAGRHGSGDAAEYRGRQS